MVRVICLLKYRHDLILQKDRTLDVSGPQDLGQLATDLEAPARPTITPREIHEILAESPGVAWVECSQRDRPSTLAVFWHP